MIVTEASSPAARCRAFVNGRPVPPSLRALWLTALDLLPAAGERRVPAFDLAMDCFTALAGAAAPVELGIATALFDAALYVMDHALDGELEAAWAVHGRAAPETAWTTLLTVAVPEALDALPLAPARRGRLHGALRRESLAVFAAEYAELRAPGPRPADEVLAIVDGKSGARRALFAKLGALAAGADDAQVEAIARFGRAIGQARQLRSDLADVLSEGSRDLAAGTWTWPLAWLWEQAEGEGRSQLARLVTAAPRDPAAHAALRRAMAERRVTMRTLLQIELALQRARRALADAQLSASGTARLVPWIEASSFAERPADPAEPAPRRATAFQDVDRAADPQAPLRFLAAAGAHPALRSLKARSLARLAAQTGETVVDLACGLGDEAAALARAVGPEGCALAFDRSATMIGAAHARHGAFGVLLAMADARALPLPAGSVDAVRIERLLHLVDRPDAVLGEARRALRPGGRVLVVEPQWSSLAIAGIEAQAADRLAAQRSGPGDGARIPFLLAAAGFEAISVAPALAEAAGFEAIDQLLDLAGRVRDDRAAAAREALRRADSRAHAVITIYLVAGRVPDGARDRRPSI